MVIDIKGHSGCNIDIIEDNGKLYVKKSTDDLKYLDRLNLQVNRGIIENIVYSGVYLRYKNILEKGCEINVQ